MFGRAEKQAAGAGNHGQKRSQLEFCRLKTVDGFIGPLVPGFALYADEAGKNLPVGRIWNHGKHVMRKRQGFRLFPVPVLFALAHIDLNRQVGAVIPAAVIDDI